MLRENNVRTGFFGRAQFESVRGDLPTNLPGVVTFAYITGWRMPSDVFTLQWRQIDFDAGAVGLDPGSTKNREGRVFPFTPELRAVGIPISLRPAHQVDLRCLADGLHGGWNTRPNPPRFSSDRPSETSSAPGCRSPLR